MKPVITSLNLAFLALLAAPSTYGQSTPDPCNESGETPLNGPGIIPGSTLKTDCTQLNINININGNLVTPAQCIQAYTYFSIQQHSCLAGITGSHCDHDANTLNILRFDDGGCPQIPNLSGIDWGSIDDIIGLLPRIIGAFACKPPASTTEKSDSASADDCDSRHTEGHVAGEVIHTNQGVSVAWVGQGPEFMPGPAGIFNPFLSAYDLAQTASPSELGGPLGAVIATQENLDGISFSASYRVEHFASGQTVPEHARTLQLSGNACIDGRFDIVRIVPAIYEGNPDTIEEKLTFDGMYLWAYHENAGSGNQIPLTTDTPAWVDQVHFQGLHAIYDWMVDPYAIPNIPGVTYDIEPGSAPDTTYARRSHPLTGGSSFVSEEYLINTRGGTPVPVKREDFDTQGLAWNIFEYSDFFAFRDGDWRPRVSTTSRYYGSAPNRTLVVETLTINRATPLDAASALLVPGEIEEDIDWMIWNL